MRSNTIAIAPDDFHAHYNLGLAHLALGDNARQNLAAVLAAETGSLGR